MNIKKSALVACVAAIAASATAAEISTLADDPRYRARHYEIDIPDGEYWWGGEVLEGLKQPFSRSSVNYAVDMRKRHGVSGGDKAAPVLLSSKGRWIWCEQAFAFKVSDGKLVIDTEKDAPIEQGRAEGGTLRAANLLVDFLHGVFDRGNNSLQWLEHRGNALQELFSASSRQGDELSVGRL